MVNIKKPIFSQFGGISKGDHYGDAVHLTWPFSKFKVYPDKIVLFYLFLRIEFKKKEIEFIEDYPNIFNLFGNGIRIHHKKLKTDPFIVFWPFSSKKLLNEVKKVGYKVK